VSECGADLRFAAFFFGERLKGLRRAGVPVDAIADERWCELFRAFVQRPARREAWAVLVRRLAEAPTETVEDACGRLGLDEDPGQWQRGLAPRLEAAEAELFDEDPERLVRYAMGRVMVGLRGRVPARTVAEAVRTGLEAHR
jgi:Glu-tRNA(Gln) amidotransferase subunit E-like FAD-binding protein